VEIDQSPKRQRFLGRRVPPSLFGIALGLAATIALGGWLTGQWMTGGIEPDSLHAGYFLPTAAGGLIGADAAAQVQLHALAQASFGIGIVSWILLGSTILNRLFTRPSLPSALVPTMAIELGIPAVAGSAYFAVAGQTVNFVACVRPSPSAGIGHEWRSISGRGRPSLHLTGRHRAGPQENGRQDDHAREDVPDRERRLLRRRTRRDEGTRRRAAGRG
jgi:hypothetical protein